MSPHRAAPATATATIYHITEAAIWERERAAGAYRADSLASEGFIHCSTAEQVLRVANERFAAQSGLVLLHVDPQTLAARLRWENTEGGEELFPHVYGAIEVAAVRTVTPLLPEADGSFARF